MGFKFVIRSEAKSTFSMINSKKVLDSGQAGEVKGSHR
jgi:hypothetical protein